MQRGFLLLSLVLLVCGPAARADAASRTIVFFGDSLTAGYGLEDPESQAYPALIQRKIDAAGLDWRVVNAGLSGETSAGGERRIDWILRQRIDAFVLELGANDGLRGLPPEITRRNLESIIEKVRRRYPSAIVILAGMRMPPSIGPDYARAFADVFPAVAADEHAALIPFLLAGVGAVPALNQADGIHPTAEGDAIVAETVWRTVGPLIQGARTPPPPSN